MANYPPPPPGGWGPPGAPAAPPQAVDPYAAQRELESWAKEQSYQLNAQPDAGFYMGWYPFQYLPRISAVAQELRVELDDAQLFVADVQLADPVGQLVGGSRTLLFFVLSQALKYRAAIRSKQTAGVADELSRGLNKLGSLLSSGGAAPPPAGAVLGDTVLEQACDVAVPTREEGNWALTMPLRQIVAQASFRGIVELRAGGMAVNLFGCDQFERQSLSTGISTVTAIHQAAIPAAPAGG